LEALAVHNAGAGLVVLLLGDPHLLEGGQGGQDGTADPDGVLPLGGSDDLDLHGGRRQGSDFLLHAVGDTRVHGGATRQHGVGIQVLTDVHVALHDGVVRGLVDAARFHTQEGRLEEGLWATEALVADGDDLSVGKLVRLLQGGRGGGGGHLLLEVEGDVAQLLLDVTDDFPLGGGGERVAALGEDLHQVVGQVPAGQVQTEDGVGQGVPFVDGDGVGHAVAGVEHDTRGTTGRVQRQDGLDGHVHGGGVEGLEHDLGHLLAVSLGVEGSLGEEDGVLLGGNAELVVEGVVPDLLHVVPVGHDAVLDGVLQGQDTTLALGLVAHVAVLLTHADHHTLGEHTRQKSDGGSDSYLVAGASHDGGEHGTGGIVPGEAGLAHAGAIVDHQSGNLVVTHVGCLAA
ncbi:unnamed protein product, partial [Ixodes hexagonus]